MTSVSQGRKRQRQRPRFKETKDKFEGQRYKNNLRQPEMAFETGDLQYQSKT
jgi:hypothetical protein